VIKQKRPTMNDVARLAGVSQATVSFVFNRKVDTAVKISEATRERVLAAAEKLNYRRNDAAKALVTGKFSSIQVFISDITDPFFDEFIHGIEVEAQAAGYHVYLRSTQFSEALERTSFSELHNSMIDGVIVCGTQLPLADRAAFARNNRIIFINEQSPETGGSLVVDDTMGYVQAVSELAAAGIRRYAFVTGPESRPTSQSRLECFKQAVHTVGDSDARVESMFVPRIGLDAEPDVIDHVVSLAETVDVLFCFNDLLAIGLMRALQKRGIRVPEDVGIVGFDGIAMGKVVSPALTTVAVPRMELGRRAMQGLLQMIEKGGDDLQETIAPTFIPRESHMSGPSSG
jgi:LacI family transcriptional regulator